MIKRKFTLVELLLVIVILFILIGLVIGGATTVNRIANESNTKAQIASISLILKQYENDWGFFPEQARADAQTTDTTWVQASTTFSRQNAQPQVFDNIFSVIESSNVNFDANTYFADMDGKRYFEDYTKFDRASSTALQKGGFRDPWGNFYYYQYPGVMNVGLYDLWSLGADRYPGDPTGLDITSMCPVSLATRPVSGAMGFAFKPSLSQLPLTDASITQPDMIDDISNWEKR